MKFSTTTITTFALVAISGLCTIPSSVEAKDIKLKAMITSNDGSTSVFKGTVTVKQKQNQRKSNKGRQQITNAKWEIDIEEIDLNICVDACTINPDNCELNWHIHERAVIGDLCDGTGGHWDPTFACGLKSQYQNPGDWCDLLTSQIPITSVASAITGRVNPQTCEPSEDITRCEMGDLSAKMGQVKIKTGKQKFYDKYISNLENIQDLSIVFHCGSPRVACGNFALVA